MTKLDEAPVAKAEGGTLFRAGDYAYVPDAKKPSTWKLRLTNKPGGKPDAGIVGAAIAALGKGFRGQKVQIPAADLGAVKAKVRAAWKKANPDKEADDMPAVLKEALSHNDIRDGLRGELRDHLGMGDRNGEPYTWVKDVFDDGTFVYEFDGACYRLDYSVDDDAVTVSGQPVEVQIRTEYVPVKEPSDDNNDTTESVDEIIGAYVPLVEGALRRDDTVPIKLIAPGWSENGRYYGESVLKTSGPTAFPTGTKMFLDHPTLTEETDRPERSVRDLAGEFVSDARYDEAGAAGPGLYADAKVLGDFKSSLDELAPHIGVSIRAAGSVSNGTVDGRSGQIVEDIAVGKSVDFVTSPAAGGEIVQLFESIRDTGATRPAPTKEAPVAELQEVQRELAEAQSKLAEQQKELDEATARATKLEEDGKRDREQLVLREARDHVAAELAKPEVKLPDITKARIVESVSANPPVKDDELDKPELEKRLGEAVKAEVEYIAKLNGSGRVTGLGESTSTDDEDEISEADQKKFEEKFARLGLSETAAKSAAAGR